jgi:hypothetical protein
VAEYVDHAVTYWTRTDASTRIWFGGGYLSKARAYKIVPQSTAA